MTKGQEFMTFENLLKVPKVARHLALLSVLQSLSITQVLCREVFVEVTGYFLSLVSISVQDVNIND